MYNPILYCDKYKTMGKERVQQLDYLKGIFILLMVLFHLELIESTYPLLRNAVYTFHMSAFLIISGYLANVNKTYGDFWKSLLRLIVPYLIFESLYVATQYLIGGELGANNAISHLSASDFVMRVVTQPTGPYWYIHTLIIATTVYWFIYKVLKLTGISGLALTGLILYGLSVFIVGLNWGNVTYFLIGVAINRSGNTFMGIITPSFLSVLPLVVLFGFPENFDNGTLAGIAITVLIISLLLSLFPYCPRTIKNTLTYLGRNSLAIVIFSPIITVITKKAVPFFSFDSTAICFALIALPLVLSCCLACAWFSDKTRLSRLVFLKDRFYRPFKSSVNP